MADPRQDLRAFGDLVRWPLEPWQARGFDLAAPITVVVAGRGMGKSRSLALFAAWSAFRRPEFQVLIVSASEAAARRLLAEVRGIATTPALRGSVVDEQAGLVSLTNGSWIRSVPASERQARGWAVDLLLVDEAAFVSDELLLGACFPTTAAKQGKIVLASSASVAAGAFYDHAILGEQGSETITTHRWIAKAAGGDCPASWITPTVVERDRESLGDLRFRAEYLTEFASGADALFSAPMLDRVTADYETDTLETLEPPARVSAGLDFGETSDRSALVALGRPLVEAEEPVFAVRAVKRWPAGYPLPDVVDEVAKSPAHYSFLSADATGLGGALAGDGGYLWKAIANRPYDAGGGKRQAIVSVGAEELLYGKPVLPPRPKRGFVTRKIRVKFTPETKAAGYSALRLLIDREQLLLPASAEELRRELLMLRIGLNPSGSSRIEASQGHDDLADAFMLSLAPDKVASGEWRTLIGTFAQRRLPDPSGNPGAPGPTVETGGGLVIPRQVAWASVAGIETTLPPAPPAPDPRREFARRVHQRLREMEATNG